MTQPQEKTNSGSSNDILRVGKDVELNASPMDDGSAAAKLRIAAYNGQVKDLSRIKPFIADVDSRDGIGRTALHWAAAGGEDACVSFLLQCGAKVNVKDGLMWTPLVLATLLDNEEAVKRLLGAGADTQATDAEGLTPLHWGCSQDAVGSCVVLLNAGAAVDARDARRRTPLHHAASMGAVGCLRELVAHGANINAIDIEGYSALHQADGCSEFTALKVLCDLGADLNTVDIYGNTPLTVACKLNHGDSLRLLLEAGADPNISDNTSQKSPLHIAAANGREELVQILLSFNANIETEDRTKRSPLHYAVSHGDYFEVTRLLLDEGANPNHADVQGTTPMHIAAYSGALKCVFCLLDSGAEANARDGKQRTALHWAAGNGHEVVCEILLQHGANVDAMDQRRRTALDWATGGRRAVVVKFLQEHNARYGWEVDKALAVAAQNALRSRGRTGKNVLGNLINAAICVQREWRRRKFKEDKMLVKEQGAEFVKQGETEMFADERNAETKEEEQRRQVEEETKVEAETYRLLSQREEITALDSPDAETRLSSIDTELIRQRNKLEMLRSKASPLSVPGLGSPRRSSLVTPLHGDLTPRVVRTYTLLPHASGTTSLLTSNDDGEDPLDIPLSARFSTVILERTRQELSQLVQNSNERFRRVHERASQTVIPDVSLDTTSSFRGLPSPPPLFPPDGHLPHKQPAPAPARDNKELSMPPPLLGSSTPRTDWKKQSQRGMNMDDDAVTSTDQSAGSYLPDSVIDYDLDGTEMNSYSAKLATRQGEARRTLIAHQGHLLPGTDETSIILSDLNPASLKKAPLRLQLVYHQQTLEEKRTVQLGRSGRRRRPVNPSGKDTHLATSTVELRLPTPPGTASNDVPEFVSILTPVLHVAAGECSAEPPFDGAPAEQTEETTDISPAADSGPAALEPMDSADDVLRADDPDTPAFFRRNSELRLPRLPHPHLVVTPRSSAPIPTVEPPAPAPVPVQTSGRNSLRRLSMVPVLSPEETLWRRVRASAQAEDSVPPAHLEQRWSDFQKWQSSLGRIQQQQSQALPSAAPSVYSPREFKTQQREIPRRTSVLVRRPLAPAEGEVWRPYQLEQKEKYGLQGRNMSE